MPALREACVLLLALVLTSVARAEDIVFATSDPAMSVGSASYNSLQQSAGIFRRNTGRELRIQPTAGATAAAQAVAGGNAFYNWGGMSSLIIAAQKDPSLVIISFERSNSFRVVVRPESPIQTVRDLKGHMVGAQSFGSAAYLFGRAVLADAGLDPQADVRWLPVGVGAQAASALTGGAIAAYAGYDSPDAIIGLLLHETLRELPSPLNDLAGMSGLIVRRAEIAAHPDLVAGICRSFYEAMVFAQANPEATVRNHWRVYPDQKPSNVPPAEALEDAVTILKARLAPFAQPGADGLYGNQTLATMQHTADELFKAGMVTEHPDMAKLIDQRFREHCGRLDTEEIVREAKAWSPPG